MISRRNLLSVGGSAMFVACLSNGGFAGRMLVADPSLLEMPPLDGAICGTGTALLALLLPSIGSIYSMNAVLNDADTLMLAELVRFRRNLLWRTAVAAPGTMTLAGKVSLSARQSSFVCA